jgi:3-isopropylmalate/(R)-2-methylmalate dehydratase small subunit
VGTKTIIEGKAIKFGDNIDTDVIFPGKYLVLTDPREIGKHALEGIDPGFSGKAKEGVVLVAGDNFGCGSSREHAPLALKYSGVRCVIAKSFARIFYRNSINVGLAPIECVNAHSKIQDGDRINIDVESGDVVDLTKGFELKATPLPDFIVRLLLEGGLVPYLKSQIGSERKT